ncbi:hypothetical protein BDC45DRAFT_535600 [Circinella umbellata]|nr:hypothetical protein BDC45DRAFT_535600 [Circinella umbellata]
MPLYGFDVITIVLNAFLITIGCSVTVGASVTLVQSRPYRRIYSAILFIALFLNTMGCLAIVRLTMILNHNGIIYIVELYFAAFFPVLIWWLKYDIMSITSYSRVQYELKQKERMQEALSMPALSSPTSNNNNTKNFFHNIIAWYVYGIMLIIFISFLVSVSTHSDFSGPIFVNFSNIAYLITYWIWIRDPQRSKDIRPLDCSSNKLFTALLICTTVGSIFTGIASVIHTSDDNIIRFLDFLHYVSKSILNELIGALILILVLLAFPRSWEQHIRIAEKRYNKDNIEEDHGDSYYQQYHILQQLNGTDSSSYPLLDDMNDDMLDSYGETPPPSYSSKF